MKRSYLILMGLFLVLLLGGTAGNALGFDIRGEIVSSFLERLNLSQGDTLIINVGSGSGVIKGDIGRIAKREAVDPTVIAGKCAVTETRETSLLCEVLQTREEIQLGDAVLFKGLVSPPDAAFQQLVLAAARSVVAPYPPSKEISVYVYEIFDDQGNVTGLSRRIKAELMEALKQKRRISIAGNTSLKEVVFYPVRDLTWIADVNDVMTKTTVDVLITGRYRMEGGNLQVTLYKVDKNWGAREITVNNALQKGDEALASNIIVPYRPIEKRDPVLCHVVLRPQVVTPSKEEKVDVVRLEAGGNPFIAQALRKVNFNILSPIDLLVKVDELQLDFGGKTHQVVNLRQGVHRVTVSFKRGYFSNDALLFTSEQVLTKEVLLDVTKSKSVVVEVTADPVPHKTPVFVNVYGYAERERQILRPISKVESDKVVETFKD